MIQNLSNSDLISRMEKLVQTERKITNSILSHICEINRRRLFADLGYPSLFEMLVKKYGYSESAAYRRIQAARLLAEVPEVAKKIESGAINLTQMAKVQTALAARAKEVRKIHGPTQFTLKPKAAEILGKIENSTQRQTELILATEFDLAPPAAEKASLQRGGGLTLEVAFTPEQAEILEQARALMSHQNPQGKWAEMFVILAEGLNEKKLGKSMAPEKSENSSRIGAAQHKAPPLRQRKIRRKYISVHTKRELFRRAKNRCEYVDPKSGLRCEGRHFLQIDHRIPLAKQGSDSRENLRVLCQTHNLLSARQWGLARSDLAAVAKR